jgi:cephalosporin-C deacetylase-like acetyl esterase
VCHGTYINGPGGTDLRLKSFDGQPLEVWVILPPVPASGLDSGDPLVVQSHGWASATGPNAGDSGPTADSWACRGYAVLLLTARGFHDSCGTAGSRAAPPAPCTNGYIRLDDERYEVRDIQYASGWWSTREWS